MTTNDESNTKLDTSLNLTKSQTEKIRVVLAAFEQSKFWPKDVTFPNHIVVTAHENTIGVAEKDSIKGRIFVKNKEREIALDSIDAIVLFLKEYLSYKTYSTKNWNDIIKRSKRIK